MNRLENSDIKFLKGVGENRAKLLKAEMNITSFRDLLYTFPYKYVDRSKFYKISEFREEMAYVQIKGSFIGFSLEGEGVRKRLIGLFSDGERTMQVVWFSKVKELSSTYHLGTTYTLFGKPSLFRNTWSMVHPEIDSWTDNSDTKGLTGVYSIPERLKKRGFTNKLFRKLIEAALSTTIFEQCKEILPELVLQKHKLMSLKDALHTMHFPSSMDALNRATHRLKLEELFYIELHILRYSKSRNAKMRGFVMPKVGENFMKFYNDILPFPLTGAQQRVVKEIHNDLSSGNQMNRLLQGDVGSGKTLVAFLTMLLAIDNNAQTCLMAPTEILATQHYENLKSWCDPLGLRIELLKGSTSIKNRNLINQGLIDGQINILVGTHAIIEEKVKFKNLGLSIIDEQHRFGVAQRARLWNKNNNPPHMLVMTATPIPRTLAMTVYGDLDVSIIDELPPGRKPITTLLRYEENRQQVLRAMDSQLMLGRQAYIVYPLIKENEKLELKSLEEGFKAIQNIFGEKYKIAFVHGQMKPQEKKFQMELFASGKAKILVSTTVIEVGVNVPNASVMIINDAHRYGLAQLHQLRGRVGRGANQSWCILMSKADIGKDTKKRLELMTKTSDGFVIAEEDMKMRGPGDIDGTLQSGLAFDIKIANLATDGPLVVLSRHLALETLKKYPILSNMDNNLKYSPSESKEINTIINELSYRFDSNINWSKIS